MKKDEKEMNERNYELEFHKKVGKSLFFSLLIIIFSVFVGCNLLGLIFHNQLDVYVDISVGAGIIFTMLYCTFTILDEIKKIKK